MERLIWTIIKNWSKEIQYYSKQANRANWLYTDVSLQLAKRQKCLCVPKKDVQKFIK